MAGRAPRIALVMGLSDHFDREIVRGVVQFAKDGPGWQLFGHGWMFSPLDDLPHWHGDGVIARVETTETADALRRLDMPVVDVAGAFIDRGFLSVRNDDRQTGRMVGEYLVERGLRVFCFFGARGVDWSIQRERGFRDAIAAVPGEVSITIFARPLSWWKTPGSNMEIARFVESLHEPAGAFACNDAAALKVIQACHSVGRPVPDGLAVVGVDNEDIMCELAHPALSSVELRLEDIGRGAAARLARAINGETSHDVTLVTPSRLVERASSRVFATRDPMVRRALELIHGHIADAIATADLVREIPLGRRSLEKKFRKETGKTIHEVILETRLQRACDLLRDTNDKVSAVAQASGFSSVQRFFEVFKAALGVTPGDYRMHEAESSSAQSQTQEAQFPN